VPDARYTLLSWLREGAAAGITTPADSGAATLASRVELDVTPSLDGAPLAPAVKVRMLGPGDVTGFDTKQVIRTDPVHLATDFEPFCLPIVEFDRPDFPWLFSPFAPSATSRDRLRPWLCLIAVRKREGVTVRPEPGAPLPVLSIADEASFELPKLAESWAWAHVQIASDLDATGTPAQKRARLATAIADPERTCSRLVCPRRLEERTPYYACVVPTFEVGRKAGLGEQITGTDEGQLAPAWTGAEDEIRLPVYYHWEFTTSVGGSFEALVRRLEPLDPVDLPKGVGRRDMDIGMAGGGLPQAPPGSHVLGLECALRLPGAGPSRWKATQATPFQNALIKRLDAPAALRASAKPTELVAPPLYGRWHALKERVPTPRGKPRWLRDLNIDPRNRAVAALGTIVVQDQQEQLMAAAWEQVGDILRANQLLMQGQLAVAVSAVLYEKHLAAFPDEVMLQVVAPALARVVVEGGDGTTVQRQINGSCLPTAALSGAFRRIFRPTGPIARRFRRGQAQRAVSPEVVVGRLAGGELRPPAWTPGGMGAIDAPTRNLILSGGLNAVPAEQRAAFAQLRAAWSELREHVPQRPCQPVPDELTGSVLAALDPTKTIPRRVRAQIEFPNDIADDPDDPVRPAMIAPEFPAPMYVPLRNLSQDWILTGLADMPPNTVTLLETNPRFIESYMVGLNHEMARELLWRGFPTDQRGSYFRQFWDVRARVPAPQSDAAREAAKDIPPIHEWPGTALGTHLQQGTGEGNVVLLVRGDLLRRYARTTISALPAMWAVENGKSKRIVDHTQAALFPIFGASLEPDVVLLGFALSESTARGSTAEADNKPGWFFMFQEQPTEPRFAIGEEGTGRSTVQPGEDPLTWADLDWSIVETNSAGYVDVTATAQNVSSFPTTEAAWGSHAAGLAFITLRRPFRMAIHADDMLPTAGP
jgi:hypothetical protein